MPFATGSGVRIHYEVEGTGVPLLLHVGFSNVIADCYQFGYVDALKADYRLVMLDPRGHGESDKPHEPDAYSPAQRVADVLTVLDALGLDQVYFLRYSMGGRIGFDPGGAGSAAFPAVRDRRGAAICTQLAVGTVVRAAGSAVPPGGRRSVVAGAERATGALPPERRQRLLAQDPEALAAVYEAFAAVPSLEGELPSFRVPTLVYCGEKDPAHGGCSGRPD